MSAERQLLSAFVGGEIDPLMAGRVDTDQYAYGLALCENWIAINEGPLVKRPGFEYICASDPSASWLGAFRFSVTQEYLIEWGALKARFYTNGARIETAPGVAYETVTPYAAADASRLSLQQSFDRLYIDHGSYPPGALSRTSAITFSHAVTTLKNGPFLDDNSDEAVTVTTSGTALGASVTVTASAAIFAAGDVGGQLRIEAKDFSTIKAWEPGMATVAIAEVVRSDGKAYTAETAGTTGSIVPSHESGSEYDGQGKTDVNAKGPYGVKWAYRHDRYGTLTITGFTSATVVTATVTRRLPDSVASVATHRWAHGAFSVTRGWPGLVLHGFGRQIHFKDLDVIGTVVGDFGGGQANFQRTTSTGQTAADLGFRRTLDVADVPLWAVADRRDLLVGTATREFTIGAVNTAAAVAGDNIGAVPQSFYGSEPVFPLQAGTDVVSIERGGRRIRWAGYDFGRDRYIPLDLTASARHITKSGIIQLALQRLPYAMLYAVRADGQLVVHTVSRLDLKGFSRIKLANGAGGAQALSAVSIVGQDGKTDELWLLVERTRPSGVVREIWKQAAWREIGDAAEEQFFVDGGWRISAASGQASFSGVTHLAGQAIAVLANGAVVTGITVANDGSFDLPPASVPAAPYVLIIGLAFTAEAVTLRANPATRGGTTQGLLKRVRKVVLRLIETLGIKVGSVESDGSYGPLEELIDRPGNAAMDAPIPLFTGDAPGPVEMEIDRDGRVRFVSDLPLAAIIPAAILSLEVDPADV